MPYYLTRDGGRLHYQVNGSGSPALIFIHGWCSNLKHWSRQVPAFSRRHKVVRVDRRGHGRSSRPEGSFSHRHHAQDIAALTSSLRIRNAIVIGHAGGGPSTLEFAGRYPELVRAAVFVDAGLYRGVAKAQATPAPQLRGDDYLAAFRAQYRGFFHKQSDPRMVARTVAEAAQAPQQVFLNELHWIMRANTIAMARKVKQPVLWVVSSDSRQNAGYVQEYLPQAQFAQVVMAGHFLHLEAPEQFNPMLRRFVDTL
ncbi:MAG: alpha/beta hydrolase [Pseudomonadales bacterium]|jgi:pimeloyl-ACP methyl ester carboxylesterase|nr:alpha/beta hydrolase [Pseudomonadales bacterium]MDP7596696.1 alpha/beta hydrolase [Pseudomonadales bacterium]HJN50340.1 alpha/beta hydrolase [Pseudomonadales bacterium]|tara:strand:+ start:526 stop:1290 length:765 start_codon:yes stop_codon:yes gene_type:complete